MTASPLPLMAAYVSGSLSDVLASSKGANSAPNQYVRALALIAQGYAGLKSPEGESAKELLTGLAGGAGDVAALARAELLNARLVGKIVGGGDVPSDRDYDAAIQAADRSAVKPAVQFRANLVHGLAALRSRDFEAARTRMELAHALAQKSKDDVQIAEADFALGRLAVWQGRADLAAFHLGRASAFWESKGNRLLQAHARYELGVMHTDRREWTQAVEILSDVIAAYEAGGAAPGYLDRARQMLGTALVGANQFDRAASVLESLRDTTDAYRFAMVHRDLGRMHLKLAKASSGADGERHFLLAREAWEAGRNKVAGWGATDFAELTLRQLEAELMTADPARKDAGSLALAGDMLARVAEAFSANLNERPHEVNARIAALEAYLKALRAPGAESEHESLEAAARTEADRLRSAAASIDFRLNDDVFALTAAVDQLAADAAIAPVTDPAPPVAEEALPSFIRRALPATERLEVLARLAEALGRIHDTKAAPCGFGPSDVVVRQPHIPVIRDFGGPGAARQPNRITDRPFAAPELLRSAKGDARSDLYVIGALLVVWFGQKPPANEGGLWMRVRRAWRGRPLAKRRVGAALSSLALELTALNPENRPATAYEAADRLRQAALSLPDDARQGA